MNRHEAIAGKVQPSVALFALCSRPTQYSHQRCEKHLATAKLQPLAAIVGWSHNLNLNQEAAALAKKIQKSFEGLI